MALILGAPLTVPAGIVLINAYIESTPFFSFPETLEVICITCENLSIFINSSTFTEPTSLIFPISFLPKSTNITCSALSFSSLISSSSNALSSSSSLPLLLVPAIGFVVTIPSLTETKLSGDEPTISKSPLSI